MIARGIIIKSIIHRLLDSYSEVDAYRRIKCAVEDVVLQMQSSQLPVLPRDKDTILEKLARVVVYK